MYTSLCRQILGYVDTVWDLSSKLINSDSMEIVQNKVVRFIKNLKKTDVFEACRELGLLPPQDRRKIHIISIHIYSLIRNDTMLLLQHTIKFLTIESTPLLSHQLLFMVNQHLYMQPTVNIRYPTVLSLSLGLNICDKFGCHLTLCFVGALEKILVCFLFP